MAKRQDSISADPPRRSGKIRARIMDEENGLQILKNVYAVRIHSKDYVLLIMEDYASTLGQLDGDITFLCPDNEYVLENIRAFYKHQHNEFTLLIQEDLDGWYGKI